MTSTYVALLRGINVGGKNVIKMADLRASMTALGLADVRTYIQSGNVVFRSPRPAGELTPEIEARLSADFAYGARVGLVAAPTLRTVVSQAPDGFGQAGGEFLDDVLFVIDPLDPATMRTQIPHRDEVDESWAGQHAVYFRRLAARASRSRLSRLTQMAMYRSLTIRNWNTTTRLLAMVEESPSSPPA